MRTQSICLSLAIVLICPFASTQWVQTSLDSVDVLCFAVCPNGAGVTNLLAGTFGAGVFVSTNNGASWVAIDSGLTDLFVEALVLDSSGNLFVGTHYGGVFLSTDKGMSWKAANSGLTDSSIQALAVSGEHIFVGTRSGGVFHSTNNGTSWIASSVGLTNTDIWCLAISREKCGDNVFAGTYGGGVYLSTNYGKCWRSANRGLTNMYVRSLAILGDNLYAATNGGVFRSKHNAKCWTVLDQVLTDRLVERLYVHGTNLFAGTWYGGVFLSTNDGRNWAAVNSGLRESLYVFGLAVSDSSLYAGTWSGGVWRRPLSEMVTSADPVVAQLPHDYVLHQNYPNPINPSTTIGYALPRRSHVTLTVFNTLGQQVATLVEGEMEAGYHEVQFDASALSSGVYIYRLRAGDFVQSRKLAALK